MAEQTVGRIVNLTPIPEGTGLPPAFEKPHHLTYPVHFPLPNAQTACGEEDGDTIYVTQRVADVTCPVCISILGDALAAAVLECRRVP